MACHYIKYLLYLILDVQWLTALLNSEYTEEQHAIIYRNDNSLKLGHECLVFCSSLILFDDEYLQQLLHHWYIINKLFVSLSSLKIITLEISSWSLCSRDTFRLSANAVCMLPPTRLSPIFCTFKRSSALRFSIGSLAPSGAIDIWLYCLSQCVPSPPPQNRHFYSNHPSLSQYF